MNKTVAEINQYNSISVFKVLHLILFLLLLKLHVFIQIFLFHYFPSFPAVDKKLTAVIVTMVTFISSYGLQCFEMCFVGDLEGIISLDVHMSYLMVSHI